MKVKVWSIKKEPEIRRKYTLKYPLLMFLGGGGRPMGGDHGRSWKEVVENFVLFPHWWRIILDILEVSRMSRIVFTSGHSAHPCRWRFKLQGCNRWCADVFCFDIKSSLPSGIPVSVPSWKPVLHKRENWFPFALWSENRNLGFLTCHSTCEEREF